MIDSEKLIGKVSTMLDKAGLKTTILAIENCARGGNNRTYKIKTLDGTFALKQYFKQSGDLRDRLSSEFAFLSYAKKVAPQFVPDCYFQDKEAGFALYEFIDGKPLQASDITENEINQAIRFFCALNDAIMKSKAYELPVASEACFSLQDHFNLVSHRIKSLQEIQPESKEDIKAKALIYHLHEYWQKLLNETKSKAREFKIDLTYSLPDSERSISPSDFGFHNALKVTDGALKFLDFEYAGWDDPAKMVGDFFSQLAVPVHEVFFENFVNGVMNPFEQKAMLINRAKLLRPIYRVKWCCIALNVFIPVHLARRTFANPKLKVSDLKKSQLLKAKFLLKNLGVTNIL